MPVLGGIRAPRRSASIDETAVPISTGQISVTVSSKAQPVAILVKSAMSVIAAVVTTANVLTRLVSDLFSLSAASVVVGIDLAVFKVCPLPGLRFFMSWVLVLLSELLVHSREPLALHLDLANWPDR